jgi:hypothetical protein
LIQGSRFKVQGSRFKVQKDFDRINRIYRIGDSGVWD